MEEVEGEPMDTLCTMCAPPDIEELRLHPDRAVDRLNDKLLQLPIKSTLEWCSWMICDAPAPTKPAPDAANSGLCGVVWKTGDTVYHCRTCGMVRPLDCLEHVHSTHCSTLKLMRVCASLVCHCGQGHNVQQLHHCPVWQDPSCAICHECFMNSDHEGHDYWMFSSGGGCCDCGDVEAWRPEGFCSKHRGTSSDCAQAVAALSQSQRRLAIAFLERITNFLTFFPGSASQSSITSDRIITARWLTNLCASSTGLRVLCGYCVAHQGPLPRHIDHEIPRLDPTSDSNLAGLSVLDRLLQSEGRMPLALRDELHHLYFELMRDFQFKQALLCHVIRHYPAFVEQSMVSPPATFSARDSSSTTFGKFTVQFKGNLVPTMVEQGLLQMLLATLLRVLQSAVSPSPLGLATRGDQITGSVGSRGTDQGNRDSLRRQDDGSSEHRVASGESRGLQVVSVTSAVVQSHLYSQLCYDIRYALNHAPISRKLYSEPRLLPILLESLELLQGMHPIRRIVNGHAEQEENSWADAFSLGTEVAHLFPCVISGLGQDLNTISGDAKVEELGWQRARYHEAVQAICSKLDHWIQQEPLDLSKDGRLSEQTFSYHLPLHRFLSAFITYGASALQLPAHQLTQSQQSSDVFERIIEHPLRLQLLLSQTRVGLWVRNGYAALKPATLYRSSAFAEIYLLPDLLLLQLGLVRLGMDRFIMRAVPIFGLCRFWEKLNGSTAEEPTDFEQVPLAEDMLHLLISVICDRSMTGEAASATVERQLLHRLALSESSTHSELTNTLSRRLVEHPHFEQALMNVATYVEPHGMLQGKYVLRREAWKRFDPYYPQYSQQELHRALERRARFLPPDAPLPTPHKPCPAFEGLCVAALSGELHALIYCVLAGAARKSRLVSERLLTTALRLVELSAEARAASLEAIREGAMESETCIKRPSSAEDRRSDMNDGGRRLRMRSASDIVINVLEPPSHFSSNKDDDAAETQASESLLDLLISLYRESSLGAARYGVLHALRALCLADERCRKIAESQLPDLCKASTDAKTSNKSETERRKRAAKERQAAIMQRFAKQQAAFEENVDPLPLQESPRASNGDEEMPDATDGENRRQSIMDNPVLDTPPAGASSQSAPRRRTSSGTAGSPAGLPRCSDESKTCALCHEELLPTSDGGHGMLSFAQRASVIRPALHTWGGIESPREPTLAGSERRPAHSGLSSARPEAEGDAGALHTLVPDASAIGTQEVADGEPDANAEQVENYHETEFFVRMEDLTGPSAEEVMSRVFRNMQQQQQKDRLRNAGSSSKSPSVGSLSVADLLYSTLAAARGGHGLHVRSCGHEVHMRCLSRCFGSLRLDGQALEAGEFTCPVCRRIANMLLPVQDVSTEKETKNDATLPVTLSADVCSWLYSAAWSELDVPPAKGSAPLHSNDSLAMQAELDNSARNAGVAHSTETNGEVVELVYLEKSLQRVLRHEESKFHQPDRSFAPFLIEGGHEAILLLLSSTSTSCAVAVNGATAQYLLSTLQSHTPQMLSLRHLALATTAMARGPKGCRLRREILRLLRSHDAFPRSAESMTDPCASTSRWSAGTDEVDSVDGSHVESRSPPLLTLDMGMFLVTVTTMWPPERWKNTSSEWQKLLLFCYSATVVQLVVCAGLRHHILSTRLQQQGAHPPDMPQNWIGAVAEQIWGDSALFDAVASSSPIGKILARDANESTLSSDPSAPHLPTLESSVELGVTQFLKHAVFFSHSCVSELSSDALSNAAAQASELTALLTALELPEPSELLDVIGPGLHALVNGWIDSLRLGLVTMSASDLREEDVHRAAQTGRIITHQSSQGESLQRLVEERAQSWQRGMCALRAQRRKPPAAGPRTLDSPSRVKYGASPREMVGVRARDGHSSSTAAGKHSEDAAQALGNVAFCDALANRCASLGPIPPRPPFIALPTNFSELYNSCIHRKCLLCGTTPVQPAICLLCGTLVCAGSECCRTSGDEECCIHAQKCHHGVGVFVVVRTTATLLVIGRRYCWWGSLYLDVHGEEDRGLTRGRPLLLAKNRLQELTTLWQCNSMREFLHNNPPPFPHLLLLRNRTV